MPYDPLLKTVIGQLKGRETQIWLPIIGGKPRATDQDEYVVRIVREIADMADKAGLKVADLSAHQLVHRTLRGRHPPGQESGPQELGVVFNLSHFMIRDDDHLLEQHLPEAGPLLFGVSINGADHGYRYAKDWKHLILTLDRGDYDVGRVLRTLKKIGYDGPIGLQCHDLEGDPRENLAHSMAGWPEPTTGAAGQSTRPHQAVAIPVDARASRPRSRSMADVLQAGGQGGSIADIGRRVLMGLPAVPSSLSPRPTSQRRHL